MDDFNLLEGLTTGHFDAKNKLVRVTFVLFIGLMQKYPPIFFLFYVSSFY